MFNCDYIHSGSNLNHLLFYRAIVAASIADTPAQFNHLVSAVSVVSENQAQLSHAIKAIQNKDRLRDCKNSEEQEGRMNCDMLNRFIVIGGPYFDPGPELQGALQNQVLDILHPYLPLSI
jgi:hypothetical protein